MPKKVVEYIPRDKFTPTCIESKYLVDKPKEGEPETTLGDLPICTECADLFTCGIVRDALALERTYSIAVAIIECPRFIQSTGRNNI
jgi:hypothetical protein